MASFEEKSNDLLLAPHYYHRPNSNADGHGRIENLASDLIMDTTAINVSDANPDQSKVITKDKGDEDTHGHMTSMRTNIKDANEDAETNGNALGGTVNSDDGGEAKDNNKNGDVKDDGVLRIHKRNHQGESALETCAIRERKRKKRENSSVSEKDTYPKYNLRKRSHSREWENGREDAGERDCDRERDKERDKERKRLNEDGKGGKNNKKDKNEGKGKENGNDSNKEKESIDSKSTNGKKRAREENPATSLEPRDVRPERYTAITQT